MADGADSEAGQPAGRKGSKRLSAAEERSRKAEKNDARQEGEASGAPADAEAARRPRDTAATDGEDAATGPPARTDDGSRLGTLEAPARGESGENAEEEEIQQEIQQPAPRAGRVEGAAEERATGGQAPPEERGRGKST